MNYGAMKTTNHWIDHENCAYKRIGTKNNRKEKTHKTVQFKASLVGDYKQCTNLLIQLHNMSPTLLSNVAK